MSKKDQVLQIVLKSKGHITLSELWEQNAKKLGWDKTGKTPKNTISGILGTLCREGKLGRVQIGNDYAYLAVGTGGKNEEQCNPSKVQKEPKKKATKAAKNSVVEPAQSIAAGNFDSQPKEEELPVVKTSKKRPVPPSIESPIATSSTSAPKRRKISSSGKQQKKQKKTQFHRYVAKIFHQLEPERKISRKAVNAVNSIIYEQLGKLVENSQSLLSRKQQSTLDLRTCRMAVQMCYQSDLAKHLLSSAEISLSKYLTNTRYVSRAEKAEITLPPTRVQRYLKNSLAAPRYAHATDIYLAAIVNELVTELLDGSTQAMVARKKKMLTPRDVFLFVSIDQDMRAAVRGTFIESGVVPKKLTNEK